MNATVQYIRVTDGGIGVDLGTGKIEPNVIEEDGGLVN